MWGLYNLKISKKILNLRLSVSPKSRWTSCSQEVSRYDTRKLIDFAMYSGLFDLNDL